MFFANDGDTQPDKSIAVRLARAIWPGASTFLLCLATIEISDIIFAIDSVPAIFAVTRDPFIVFTSNVFAILGLRSMYFLLSGVVGKFPPAPLRPGIVLVFIGLKMSWLNNTFRRSLPDRNLTWR